MPYFQVESDRKRTKLARDVKNASGAGPPLEEVVEVVDAVIGMGNTPVSRKVLGCSILGLSYFTQRHSQKLLMTAQKRDSSISISISISVLAL